MSLMQPRPTFRAPNGMNLSKSSKNPHSNLAMVIRFVRDETNAGRTVTRISIIKNVFRKSIGRFDYNDPNTRNMVSRGWGSYLFSLAIAREFLTARRVGRSVTYTLGPKASEATV